MHDTTVGARSASSELADAAEDIARAAEACASGYRVELLAHLLLGPADVTTLATRLGLSLAQASRDLSRLRIAGLIVCQKQGTRLVCRLCTLLNIERTATLTRIVIGLEGISGAGLTLTLPSELIDRLRNEMLCVGDSGDDKHRILECDLAPARIAKHARDSNDQAVHVITPIHARPSHRRLDR